MIHPSEGSVRTRKRNLLNDLGWGARQGLLLTAIVFVPAFLIVASRVRQDLHRLLTVFASYLAFGLAAGLLVGLTRPLLNRRRPSVLVGAATGAVGLFILVSVPTSDHPTARLDVGIVAALLGATAGALLGWRAWKLRKR